MSIKRLFNNSTAMRFFITYIVIISTTISISFISTRRASEIISENTIASTQMALLQTAEIVSGYLQQAQKTATSVYLNKYLNTLTSNSSIKKPQSNYTMIKLHYDMSSYSLMNSLYIEVFAFLNKYSYAVTSNALYSYDRFYGKFFTYGSLGEDEWFQLLRNNINAKFLPVTNITYNNSDYRAIMLLFPTSTVRGNNSKGEIVVLLNESYIREALENTQIGPYGWCYIINEEGEIITTIQGDKVTTFVPVVFTNEPYKNGYYMVDGKNLLVTTIESSYNNWRYVSVVPKSYVLSDMISFEHANMFLMLLAAFLGFLLSFGFTSINMRPLKKLVSSLNTQLNEDITEIQNEYDYIKSSFDKVNSKNLTLQHRIEMQLPMMHMAALTNLLNDSYVSESERLEMLRIMNIDLGSVSFSVMIVKIASFPDNPHNIEHVKIMIGSEIMKEAQDNAHLQYSEDNKLVILYVLRNSSQPRHELEGFARTIINGLMDRNEIDAIIGIGGIYSNSKNISRSYKEALYVIEYLYHGRNIIWYDELNCPDKLEDTRCLFDYSRYIENHLINAVKNGDSDQVNELYKKIYYDNFVNRQISLKMGKHLINELYGSALRAMDQVGCTHLADEFDTSTQNLDDSYENLRILFGKISVYANEKKNRYKTRLIKDIIAYIDVEYTSKSISLSSIGDHFGLSETRLSHLFKDEMNENISKYIEKKRIELACTMLKNKLIKDIANEVGYSSELTFSRAFKRVTGFNPSEYNPPAI